MNLNRLRETDLFGRFLLKAPNGGRFDGYYRSLNAIRPLVRSKEWLRSVTGFYINVTSWLSMDLTVSKIRKLPVLQKLNFVSGGSCRLISQLA